MRALRRILATIAWIAAIIASAAVTATSPTWLGWAGVVGAVAAIGWGLICAIEREHDTLTVQARQQVWDRRDLDGLDDEPAYRPAPLRPYWDTDLMGAPE